MGFDSILRTAKQVLYYKVPLDKFEERLDIPTMPVYVRYLQPIDLQLVCNIGDEL